MCIKIMWLHIPHQGTHTHQAGTERGEGILRQGGNRLLTVHERHIEILESLKNKDRKTAAGLMGRHLVNAEEYVLSRLKTTMIFYTIY